MNCPGVLLSLNLVYILVIHWDTNKKEITLKKKQLMTQNQILLIFLSQ